MCQASKLSNCVISTVKCNSSLACILREGTDSFFEGEGCGLFCSPKREVWTIFSPIVATMLQVSILCGEELGPDLYGMCLQVDCPVH